MEEKVRDVLGEEGIELIDEFLKIYPDKAPMDLLSVDTIFREPTIRFIKERVKCPDSKIYSFQFTYEFPDVRWKNCMALFGNPLRFS